MFWASLASLRQDNSVVDISPTKVINVVIHDVLVATTHPLISLTSTGIKGVGVGVKVGLGVGDG